MKPGENIALKGEDVKKGETILSKGIKLGPFQIAMLAALGFKKIRVRKKPLVGILSTGDEIVEPGKRLPIGKVYDANSYGLYSSVMRYGGEPLHLGIGRDDYRSLRKKIRLGLKNDILLISGGVSEGA